MNLRVRLARIKRKLLKKPFLKDKGHPPYWFEKTFGGKRAHIVQIGSNDGKTGDPLFQLLNKNAKWSALFVEPVPYLFDRLKKNYGYESRFSFENVAINDGNELTFHWVKADAKKEFPNLPFWYDQLGSFDDAHIVNELGDKIKPYIVSKKLEGLTLPILFDRNKNKKIDILHIDTEGYDWKILSQLNLKKFNPTFILFEANHLSDNELKEAHQFLKEKYFIKSVGIDLLAVHKELESSILSGIEKSLKTFNLSNINPSNSKRI